MLDNLSAPKTRKSTTSSSSSIPIVVFLPTQLFVLAQSGRVVVAKIRRDVIRRGVFKSVADLGKKLRKYIRT